MIYLRTGANGSCKTLFTLADVRKLQLQTGRPVCVNGRFKIKPEKLAEFGWKVIEFKDWQLQDDGTIFMIDECHNDMPTRTASSAVPKEISAIAEHRARGFDFFLLTQHPSNIDPFVRKIIGSPGWHQHLKRRFGGTSTTSVLQWDAVNANCEKSGSGKTAQVVARSQPREVFDWYESASLHTAKVRIPKQVYVIAALAVLVPLGFWFGFHKLQSTVKGGVSSSPAPVQSAAGSGSVGGGGGGSPVASAAELVASYQARLEGFPQTAPRYEKLTAPVAVPYPAACLQMGSRCQCYTQQATKLDTPAALCVQIVKNGFFVDWQNGPVPAVSGPPGALPVRVAQSGGDSFQDRAPAFSFR